MSTHRQSGFTLVEIMIDKILRFDQKYDDGNLSTGLYHKLAGDRYYRVIAE
ncbi:MAG: hypothetical protein ACLFVC_08210 [Opitutales bacterium]